MLQNRGYSVLNGPISRRVAHKNANKFKKKLTDFLGSYLHRMFIEYSKEYIPKLILESSTFCR